MSFSFVFKVLFEITQAITGKPGEVEIIIFSNIN